MLNVEFKAELKDAALARSICLALGATAAAVLEQTDTYFEHAGGRFKKRETPGAPAEWIVYERPDVAGMKVSAFAIYTEEEACERSDLSGLKPWAVVRKVRELLMFKNVRIHLDRVESLGEFLEFEALVSDRDGVEECRRTVAELRRALATAMGEAVAVGYSDLVARRHATESR